MVNNGLYLAQALRGGPQLAIASLGMQMLLGVGLAWKEGKAGRWGECLGNAGMVLIRGGQIKTLRERVSPNPRMALPHTLRDTIARHLLYISSLCRVPIAWTGWGGGFYGYFGPTEIAGRVAMRCKSRILPGEYDNQSTYLKEVSYRAALCCASSLVLPVAYPLLAVGTALRGLAFLVQENDFTLVQRASDLQKVQPQPLRALWWNVCGVFSGMGRDHGGVADWETRASEIAKYVRDQDRTVFGATEIYDASFGEELRQELERKYPFSATAIGASTIGALGGLGVFSKTPLIDPSFHRFANSSDLQPRGFFSAVVETLEAGFIRLIFTHLTHSESDANPTPTEQATRAAQWAEILAFARSQTDPVIIAGDLNSGPQELVDFTHPSHGETGYSYTNRHSNRMWGGNWPDASFLLDYFREVRTTETPQLDLTVHVHPEVAVAWPLSDHTPVTLDAVVSRSVGVAG